MTRFRQKSPALMAPAALAALRAGLLSAALAQRTTMTIQAETPGQSANTVERATLGPMTNPAPAVP